MARATVFHRRLPHTFQLLPRQARPRQDVLRLHVHRRCQHLVCPSTVFRTAAVAAHRHEPHGVQRAQLLGIAYRPDPAILVLRRILRPDRPITAHFAPEVWVTPLFQGIELLKPDTIVTVAFIAVSALIGIAHFMRNSYKDKIRTRMIYETLITVTLFCLAFMILQPCHHANLTGILAIHAAVLTGHFIALTNTKITNIAFCLLTAAAIAITVSNLITGQ